MNNDINEDNFLDENEYVEDSGREIQMQAGIKDFERAGTNNMIDCDLYIDKKQSKKFLSQIETFCKSVNAISLDIINNARPALLSESDLSIILENIRNLQVPEYKNPTAYILGYYSAAGSTTSLNQAKMIRCFNMLSHSALTDQNSYIVTDTSVWEADVVRYGRLWLNLNKVGAIALAVA